MLMPAQYAPLPSTTHRSPISAVASSRSAIVSGSPGAGVIRSPLSQQWPTTTYFLVPAAVPPLRFTTTSGCCAPYLRRGATLRVSCCVRERRTRSVARRTARGAALPSCPRPASGTCAWTSSQCPASKRTMHVASAPGTGIHAHTRTHSARAWMTLTMAQELASRKVPGSISRCSCVVERLPASAPRQLRGAASAVAGAPCGPSRWRTPRTRRARARPQQPAPCPDRGCEG